MIGRVLKRGDKLAKLLYYLYGPGKACEHTNPIWCPAGGTRPNWSRRCATTASVTSAC